MATDVLHRVESPITEERRIVMSFEECLTLPECIQAEWVDREAIIFRSTTIVLTRLVSFLMRLIGGFVDEFGLGEVLTAPFGMRLRQGRSFREPDILFVATAHRNRLVDIAIEGPTDLVIEVISDD